MYSTHHPQCIRLTAILLFLSISSFADPTTATLTGAVTDPSGAAVVGAFVKLHQVAGSATITVTSDRSGRFVFANVQPGDYLIDSMARGLTIAEPEAVNLVAAERKDIAIHLIVSAINTEVTVTAASEPQSADQVSKALDTVNAAEAQQRGIFSIADAVRFVPGLRVSVRGSPGAYTTIQTRGLRIQDTAILIDGFPFRDPTSPQDEASAYIGDLLLVDTSRIEVLRGSGSSLYGTNAVSGTVNTITDSGGGPLRGDLDAQGGGLGLFHGVAHLGGGAFNNRFTYSGGLSNLNVSDGVEHAGAVRDWSAQAGLTYALTSNIRLGAVFFGSNGFLQEYVDPAPASTAPTLGIIPAIPLTPAQLQLADANLPYNPGTATFIPSLGDPDYGRYSHFISALFRFEHEVSSRFSYRIAYGVVDTHRNNTNGPAGPNLPEQFQPLFNTSDRYDGGLNTLQARVNYLLGSRQIFTAGYEFQNERYLNLSTDQNPVPAQRAYYRTDANQSTNSAFAQDQLQFLDNRLSVLLSARFTHPSLEQPAFIPATSPYAGLPLPSPPNAYTADAAIAYLFKHTSTKIRVHAGNSFRLPSLYERFGGYFYGTTFFPFGDPRLSPERAVSGDFGFDQYLLNQHLKISGTYFYAHLQQVIGFLDFPPGYVDPYGRTGGYYNTGGGISRGVEISGELRPSSRTTVFASYTYTNAQDRTSQYYIGTAVEPLQTPRILRNMVTIVAMKQFGNHVDAAMDFDAGSDYLYPLYGVSTTASDAFRFDGPRQLGISAGYSTRLSERVSSRFYVRVWNVLNQNFFEDGFATARRWAVGGIHLSF